jgi:hypothetical protein
LYFVVKCHEKTSSREQTRVRNLQFQGAVKSPAVIAAAAIEKRPGAKRRASVELN